MSSQDRGQKPKTPELHDGHKGCRLFRITGGKPPPPLGIQERIFYQGKHSVPISVILSHGAPILLGGNNGYFINDDYTKFYPVHRQAEISGEHQGSDGVPRVFTSDHPFIEPDPTVEIRVGQRVPLTLLLYATGSVHATTGFLPRKEITFIRDHVERAMEAMAPSFKIGPVLVHPGEIRIPVPNEQGFTWNWDYRDSRVSWSEEELATLTDDADLHDDGPTVTEGWLKLRKQDEEPAESE